jgi:Cof subfamily protein (haloacid dehalogenase superfamily)
MRYPLIATDMDGTLLGNNLDLSDYTKNVIKKYTAAGGTFVVSTGRMYASFYNTAKRLGLDDGIVIAYQGAYMKDSRSGELIYHKTLHSGVAVKILTQLEKENVAIQIYFDDKLYVKRRTAETKIYEKVCEVEAIELNEELSAYVAKRDLELTKILIIAEEEKTQRLYRSYPRIFGQQAEFHVSRPCFFEVVAKGSDKGSAVKYLCDKMGLTSKDVITFGDNYNDVTMLEFAGLSFAVENANDAAKKAAKQICPSNDDDGVANMIEKYCL